MHRFYYHVKPYVPSSLRLAIRRVLARRKRLAHQEVWPINEVAGRLPESWTGWPDGKQFALVLSHDVEGPRGLERCQQLMDLEMRLGFRSSFNFIPEGSYAVPKELRDHLTAHGFEVGVHDLKHDGKLYSSRAGFRKCAAQINQYLHQWNAVGFRSGFMHHNLAWLHDLNVQYDASPFDTDPFEPQPDGVDTIFPFWVPQPGTTDAGLSSQPGSLRGPRSAFARPFKPHLRNGGDHDANFNSTPGGYVELPYTLPQDSTLFLVLGEKTFDVWQRKLDWIVEHGGMAHLDTHPDYIDFSGVGDGSLEYPVTFYQEFLEYVRSRYAGSFWHATPQETADFVRGNHRRPKPASVSVSAAVNGSRRPSDKKIWIDLDNTPHVPLFEPIIEELEDRGYNVVLTARDAFQVCELAKQKGMRYIKVGRHHGKNRIRKVAGLFYRAMQLAPIALREKPVLGLSHGARSQIIICNLLRIPTVMMADYEYAKLPPLMRPTWEMVPEVIPDSALYCPTDRIRKYPGIKEDVYVPRFQSDPAVLTSLGITGNEIIVTARPPATEAHYHNPESETLFLRFMDRACRTDGVRVVLLPRNWKQGHWMQKCSPHWFANGRTVIPATAINGLNLLWYSDLVVSGGGTMNREAAALGVPVYSIFRGKIGAVDHYLQKERRLTLIENVEDVDRKIQLSRRVRNTLNGSGSSPALAKIIQYIEELFELHSNA